MTVAIPMFKTGPITCFASIDAYGLESSRFLGAVYSLHIDVHSPHPSVIKSVCDVVIVLLNWIERILPSYGGIQFCSRMAST